MYEIFDWDVDRYQSDRALIFFCYMNLTLISLSFMFSPSEKLYQNNQDLRKQM